MSETQTRNVELARLEKADISLCDALDRLLNTGAVVVGEICISVADVELVYLGLQLVLASVETARGISLKVEIGEERSHAAGQPDMH